MMLPTTFREFLYLIGGSDIPAKIISNNASTCRQKVSGKNIL
jgi:hypothetical protein